MTNTANTFTVTFEDGFYRTMRVTYRRGNYGAFPTMINLERKQDNGRVEFWTKYRENCHGALSTTAKQELKRIAEVVRWQA